MPLIKNPFKSKVLQPANSDTNEEQTLNSKATESVAIASPQSSVKNLRPPEPDYKLSSVSPEGTFMPPSPPEKTSFLSRFRHPGSLTNDKALASDEQGGFVIPRESFDTYRRSFDIRPSMDGSGMLNDGRPSRSSLDLLTATGTTSPRRPSQTSTVMQSLITTNSPTTTKAKKENILQPPLTGEITASKDDQDFEDVKLDDDVSIKKKHFWQKSSSLSAGAKKGRIDENELSPIKLKSASNGVSESDVNTHGASTRRPPPSSAILQSSDSAQAVSQADGSVNTPAPTITKPTPD